MNPLIKLLAIMASVFLLGFFLEETIDSSGLNNPQSLEETFEILSELFSVFVALSIFAITWYAYNKSGDNHSLFLGTTFLITGLLILFHLLSYPFMPDFINPNSAHKSAVFFLESRFILAFLLLASVYVHKDSLPKLINKYILVLFTIAILSVSLTSVFFQEYLLFRAFDLNSYSTATVFLLLIISIIIFVAGYLYTKRAKETGQNTLNYLAKGSAIVLFGNLVYFSYEFSGHFLIITGFFYFYLGLYKSSVELPYEKLAIAEEKLRKGVENKYSTLFDNANDAIITTDLEYHVTSWNRSAVKLFGWEAHEVMGKKLSGLIVPLNLQTQGEGIIRDTVYGKSAFGIETVKIRKDGSSIFVSLTTSQLLDSNHNLSGLSFIIRDITGRKRAEQAIEGSLKRLEEEKAKTESIIAAIGDAISIQDTDFKILYQNKIHQDITGDQKGEYCYKKYEHRDHICEDCPVDMSLKDGKIHTQERSIIKGEQKMYFEITASPLRDSTGNIIAGIEVGRNITERKKAEEERQISERKYSTLVEKGNDGIIIIKDGLLEFSNSKMADIAGYTIKEVVGKPFFDFVSSEYKELVINNYKKRLSGEAPKKNYEIEIISKEGKNIPVEINASLIDYEGKIVEMAIIRDITEHKRVEGALREVNSQLKTLINHLHAGILVENENHIIMHVNQAFCDMFSIHVAPEKLIGLDCSKSAQQNKFLFADPEEFVLRLNTLLTNRQTVNDAVLNLVDGRVFERDFIPVYYEDVFVGYMWQYRDITERKKTEKQIEASLHEKETLLKEIHHRVKNNLQIVSSLLDHQTQFIKDKNVIEIFTESQNRIASMALVHEKLYQSKDLAKIDFLDYINDLTANLFQSYAENSGKIRLNLNIENIQLDIDFAIPCGLIINELVTNSLKYAFPAGREGEIKVVFCKTDEYMLKLVISDNGIGIPSDLDFRRTGSMGLHLVTILAENQLHGEINLNRNEGTEFEIEFKGIK